MCIHPKVGTPQPSTVMKPVAPREPMVGAPSASIECPWRKKITLEKLKFWLNNKINKQISKKTLIQVFDIEVYNLKELKTLNLMKLRS